MDIDRRVQHHGPPLVDEARSSSAVRTEPYDIHLDGRDHALPGTPGFVSRARMDLMMSPIRAGGTVRSTIGMRALCLSDSTCGQVSNDCGRKAEL
jgi:hypothetical protein